ncbi:Chemotaxis regulator - transmits chemoreceptor signals to flagellar motor components CheY [hydrothermal vent metagenome]|uniref:Chemotaxis regulator - transmits chemoreceptor signals to flagellar motor components CheY n=1 Tax=hydrothermal vent metagenome TaxID=652676 RepID=A0A3B1B3S3_9ZZZZ
MKKTALTIDDSKTMRDMVSFTLKNAGYDVVEAENGQLGLDKIAGASFDVIITDVNMPVMDGITFTREARKRVEAKTTPILILTTESGSDIKNEGRSAGATGWIVKPFNPEKLLQVVEKVCGF